MASNLEPKINRIATAVTSALSALTAKGVTVPEGANVESLAALIASIEAGGGNTFAFGSITPESNGPITITHNFGDGYNTARKIKGKTTILIVAAAHENISAGVYSICLVGGAYYESNNGYSNDSYTRWGNGFIHTSSPSITSVTSESFTINNSNESYPFVAGTTYHYAVWDNGKWKE